MLDRFPDGVTVAVASKQVADKLDEATEELRKNKGDAEVIKENLRRTSKYYKKWFNEGLLRGLSVPMSTIIEVANRLYFAAKEINGLGNEIVSFVDLKDRKVLERQYFSDSALVLSNLVDGRIVKLDPKIQIELMTRLARCSSFLSSDAQEWAAAKDKYDDILKSFKLVDAKGDVDGTVLEANPGLLDVYIELGNVYIELARTGAENSFQFDNASNVFNNVLRFTSSGSERWWSAKYAGIKTFSERGKGKDIEIAKTAIHSLELSYPDFDGGKYGMKERFIALRDTLAKLTGDGDRARASRGLRRPLRLRS